MDTYIITIKTATGAMRKTTVAARNIIDAMDKAYSLIEYLESVLMIVKEYWTMKQWHLYRVRRLAERLIERYGFAEVEAYIVADRHVNLKRRKGKGLKHD